MTIRETYRAAEAVDGDSGRMSSRLNARLLNIRKERLRAEEWGNVGRSERQNLSETITKERY